MELYKQLGKFRYNESECSSVVMNGSYFACDCNLFQTVNKLILFMFFFLKATILSQIFKRAQISCLWPDKVLQKVGQSIMWKTDTHC